MAALSGLLMLIAFLVFATSGFSAAAVRRHIITRPKVLTWMRRTFAVACAAPGAKLALAER